MTTDFGEVSRFDARQRLIHLKNILSTLDSPESSDIQIRYTADMSASIKGDYVVDSMEIRNIAIPIDVVRVLVSSEVEYLRSLLTRLNEINTTRH